MVQVTSKLQMSRLSFDSVVVVAAITFKPDAPIVRILPNTTTLLAHPVVCFDFVLEEGIKAAVYSSVAGVGGATSHKQMHASPPLIQHPFDSFILSNTSPQLGGVREVTQFLRDG